MNYLIGDDEDDQGEGQGQQATATEAPPAPAAPAAAPMPPAPQPAAADTSDDWLSGDDDDLLAGMDDEPAAPAAPAAAAPAASAPRPAPAAQPAPMAPAAGDFAVGEPQLQQLDPHVQVIGQVPNEISSLVLDVEVPVEVAFGNASLTVEEFLELGSGSVVELDREVSAPVELKVRGKIVAHGQLVTIGGRYGLRITDMNRGS